MTDLAQVPNGTVRAFDDLFTSEYGRLVGLATHLVGNRALAEELVQDVFSALLVNDRLSTIRNPPGWLRTALVNRVSNEARRASRERAALGRRGPDREVSEPADAPPTELIAAVSALPLNQRVALVLVDGDGLSPVEAAEAIGCAPPTVRVHLHRARHSIRSTLSTLPSSSEESSP